MRYYLLLYILLFSVCVSGQELTHKLYTIYDGLPQSQVQCVAQDSAGFIWVGTKGGVARFDGQEFETFTTKDGLVSNEVNQILATDSIIYFVGYQGVSVWDGHSIKPYPIASGNRVSLFEAYLNNRNELLLRTRKDFFLFHHRKYHKQKDNFRTYKASPNSKFSLIAKGLDGLYGAKDGDTILIDSLWASHHVYFLNDTSYYYVARDTVIKQSYLKMGVLDTSWNILSQPYGGYGILGEASNQVFIYRNDSFAFLQGEMVFPIKKKFNFFRDAEIDREGNLWVADEDGLYCFHQQAFMEYTKQNSNLPGYVWDIKEWPTGKYWFATYGNGLYILQNREFVHYEDKFTKNNDFRSFYFNTPKSGPEKMILNWTRSPIVFRKNNTPKLLFKHQVSSPLVTFYDSINDRFFSGCSRNQLFIRESNKEEIAYEGENSPFTRNILDICYDRDNNVCLGHRGITRYVDGEFQNYPNIPDTMTWRIFTMEKDYRGNLWLGTDQGIWFYNYDTIFQIDHPHLNRYITLMEPIDTTWLMLGTTHGLPLIYLPDFYNNGTIRVKYYDRENGFTGRECGQNGTLHDSKGMFWIPTIDRVIKLDPSKIRFNTYSPPAVIKKISLLGDNLNWHTIPDTLHKFTHNQNGYKFEFAGLSYSAPGYVTYKYRLLGYNKNWSDPISQREAVFSNLNPGKYTFEVLAANEDGVWSEKPATWQFQIVPAWYQRITVKIGGILFLSGLLVWFTFMYVRRRAVQQQERMENRNRMLNMSLNTIKSQMDPHFTFNAINGIESLIMKEDRQTAYNYLLKLSSLIRSTINDNELLSRTLREELQFVQSYLELEKFRFKEKFNFSIEVDVIIDQGVEIPKLLIQIFAENAIKHGLMHKDTPGNLWIRVVKEREGITITVEDNGIGRQKAKEYAIHSTGKGLNIVRKLIRHYNEQNERQISFKIIDLGERDSATGTRVLVFLKNTTL
ncbi:MAG: histidine kinase [Salinivirgaceae bacterium]|jgi:hypothetical protein|nr:histidine kinase [Salinivirgaceae bacterium]